VTLILIVVLLAPLAVHVPLAALAAILFVVAWNMSDLPHFAKMVRRAPRADVAILLITFALTVFADLVLAVNIGVLLAMMQFLRRMASSVEVREATGEELREDLGRNGMEKLPPGVLVYTVEGPFFFGAVEKFEHALTAAHIGPEVLVIRLRWVPFVDITAMQTLEEVVQHLRARKVRVILTGANERVAGKLERAGIIELVGRSNVFPDLAQALAACRQTVRPPNSAWPRPRPG
jgi:SulP family sulfate permease